MIPIHIFLDLRFFSFLHTPYPIPMLTWTSANKWPQTIFVIKLVSTVIYFYSIRQSFSKPFCNMLQDSFLIKEKPYILLLELTVFISFSLFCIIQEILYITLCFMNLLRVIWNLLKNLFFWCLILRASEYLGWFKINEWIYLGCGQKIGPRGRGHWAILVIFVSIAIVTRRVCKSEMCFKKSRYI